jgi:hypothetical protein
MSEVVVNRKRGIFAVVDDVDFEEVSKYNWYLVGRSVRRLDSERGWVSMPRSLLDAPDGMVVDHINHNTLDNRRSNLRVCLQSENIKNCRIRKDNRSGFKGVDWYPKYKKWRARIQSDKKPVLLGYFDDPKLAHLAYVTAAYKFHKDFTCVQ